MRLPNGYGSVSKLSGRRRRPFIVRKDGKILGYTTTREEGLEMLADYNRDPWDIDAKKATFADVYQLWLDHKSSGYSESVVMTFKSAFNKHTKHLHSLPYASLKLNHFTQTLEACPSNSVRSYVQKFLKAMDKVAYEYEIIEKRYTEMLSPISVETKKERQPFSEDEINILWDNLGLDCVKETLILIYTGFRIGEFIDLDRDNIDLEGGIIIGGSKTKAGKNRRVPIHHRIKPLVKELMEKNNGKLYRFTKETFGNHFRKLMSILGMEHVVHETRHTLRTLLDNANANKVSIDLILGHASQGTGERVYTHKTIEQLKETIELLD